MPELWAGLEDRLRRRMEAALTAAGQEVAAEAKRLVQRSPRGGRLYEKYEPRRSHKASAPGEAPATDLGGLARSITVIPEPARMACIVKCAKALAPYAKALEYGTTDGRIAARPFLRPALKRKTPVVNAIIRRALREAIRNA